MTTMSRPAPTAKIYGGADPRELPAFPLWEVSHILWTARPKLARWAFGYSFSGRRQQPVIRIADPQRHLLSFNNLAELHVLSSIRTYDISLQKIRRAVEYIGRELGDPPHPLLAHELQTDGASLFVEQFGQYVNITQQGQMALRQVIEAYLERIERDPSEHAVVRLFPFSTMPLQSRIRSERAADELPKVISIDARVQFGRPVVRGTHVPTVELASRFSAGETLESIAEDMGLETEQVQHAIRYELAPRQARTA
jgi:uncharacterized protein (DUF433 family)